MSARFLIISTLLFALSVSANGQAWTQKRGQVYTKLFYGQTSTNTQYNFDGAERPYSESVDDRPYLDQSVYMYTEIGLSNSVMLFSTIPYKRVTVRDASFQYNTRAVGSANVGLALSISRLAGSTSGRTASSFSIMGSIPTGYTRNYAPSAGSGQIDITALLAIGRSFYPAPFYMQMSGGYQHKTNLYQLSSATACQAGQNLNCVADAQPDFADQLLFSAEAGVNLGRHILVQALVGGVWSIEPPETGFSVYNPFPTQQRYIKTGAGLRLELPGSVGISGQVRYTPWGANTIKSTDYFVGIDISFAFWKCCENNQTSTQEPKEKEDSQDVPFSKPHQRRY